MRSSVFLSCLVIALTPAPLAAATFGDDVAFLRRHIEVVVLSDRADQAQVAVVPAYQGRVMTSTAAGADGPSFGWVNRALIASGQRQPHINVFGGEDRFWLGPEGGQFSIFFAPGVPFDLEHWFTPAALDTEPFEVIRQSRARIVCRRSIALTNYAGTPFHLEMRREVRLLQAAQMLDRWGTQPGKGTRAVAFESVNAVKNAGKTAWQKETGLLSIWILGMLNASPQTTVVIPFRAGPEATLGPIVNDTYFGKVPADRLVIKPGVLFFRADAQYRSKIGLSPRRARPVLGSYDAAGGTLTLVEFDLPPGETAYVNSMWERQREPFGGDAVNSYNDGPPAPGAPQLGLFYELESSSPALALRPGRSATHVHRTLHLQGDDPGLDAAARAVLGVGLAEIRSAFPH
jgi:hypothetical protein